MECCYDQTAQTAFRTIDDINYGYIDHNALKRFFRNVGHVATDKEITAVVRRIDLDADSRLNLREFTEGIKAEEPYSRLLVKDRSSPMKKKVGKSGGKAKTSMTYMSPYK
jgi:hypothetical protein